jgi:hypothetical protein
MILRAYGIGPSIMEVANHLELRSFIAVGATIVGIDPQVVSIVTLAGQYIYKLDYR